MKKAVVLASLAVMSASVWGMNNSLSESSGSPNETRMTQITDNGTEIKKTSALLNADLSTRELFAGRCQNILDPKARGANRKPPKILNLKKVSDEVDSALDKLWNDRLLLYFIKLLSPRTIQKISSDIDGNSGQKNKEAENVIESLQSELSEKGFKLSKDLINMLSSNTAKSMINDIQGIDGNSSQKNEEAENVIELQQFELLGKVFNFINKLSSNTIHNILSKQLKKKGKSIEELSLDSVRDFVGTSSILSTIIRETDLVDSGDIVQLLLLYKNKAQVSSANFEEMCNPIFNDVRRFCRILGWQEYPLHFAVEEGKENFVKCLVKFGSDVNKEDKYGYAPLIYACRQGSENIVKHLVKHGADVNKISGLLKKTPLIEACEEGHENIVKYLVEHGADVNKEDKHRDTPLFKACEKGNENIVKYLVEHGADVNKINGRVLKKTPLIYACEQGSENIVRYLVKQGADVNKANEDVNTTPLTLAVSIEHLDIVRCLVELGANVDEADRWENTPLIYACRQGSENIVKHLVEHGADVNKADRWESTPLIYACRQGSENIVKHLVEHGADVNKEGEQGFTPLFEACKQGSENIVRYLVEHGADVNKENEYKEVPLVRVHSGNESIRQYLIKHGARE